MHGVENKKVKSIYTNFLVFYILVPTNRTEYNIIIYY